MRPFHFVFLLAVLGSAVAGCGPMQVPMPPRLDDEGQKKIDEGWDRALQPVEHFNHQTLLDMLMVTRGYEAGVDRLTFRSEKRVAVGTVVMEVHFDRAAPLEDRFEVQILDEAGKVLRKERYTREEIEKTNRELFVEYEELRQQKQRGTITAEGLQQLTAYEAREKVIEEIFPAVAQKEPTKPGP